jgi:predicted  nucleic acid-binding Zn ribbon protein
VFSTNGTGIDFSASAGGGASSSILDDYEEGTYTVTQQTEWHSNLQMQLTTRVLNTQKLVDMVDYLSNIALRGSNLSVS